MVSIKEKEQIARGYTEDPDHIVNNSDDPVLTRMSNFFGDSWAIVSKEMDDWVDAKYMYESCFDGNDDIVQIYNPALLADITTRFIDGLKLADYDLIIPGSSSEERTAVRHYMDYIEVESGLTSEIRDDDKGALSWSVLGNVVLWWGKASKNDIKRGVPINFQTVRLNQALFSKNATSVRNFNGKPMSLENMLIFDRNYDELLAEYPIGKKKGPITGSKFGKGRLPFAQDSFDIQNEENDEVADLTQQAYWYDLKFGRFYVVVGSQSTIVEAYDDNNPSLPNYPFKLDGENYFPGTLLKAFPVIGNLYGKGLYHKFGKVARNDARRRNMAHLYADHNVNPDKFVRMSQDRFATFQNDVDIARELRGRGEDAYVQLAPDEDVQVGNLNAPALSGEFERMRSDDTQIVNQGGIGIQDVNYKTSEKLGVVSFEEKNKNRLVEHTVKVNTGEARFIRRAILQFVKDYIKEGNETSLPTSIKVSADENDPLSPQKELGIIPIGEVAEYIRTNIPYIKMSYSAQDSVDYAMSKKQLSLNYAQGTPAAAGIQQDILGLLGTDITIQELQQAQNDEIKLEGGTSLPTQTQAVQTTGLFG